MSTAPARRPEPQAPRDLRAIFRLCSAFGLDRGDRINVATVLLNREVSSYRDLSPAELARLRDGLEGAALVCQIQMERRAAKRR